MEELQIISPNFTDKQHEEEEEEAEIMIPKNPKTTRGRQKIEIKEIKEESKRQVTFSKRRRGLFKKAAELSVLCGAHVAVVTFSRCGRIYTFGSCDIDSLIHKYLHPDNTAIIPTDHSGARGTDVSAEEPPWWDLPLESIPEEEMEEYLTAMRALRENVISRIRQINDQTVENALVEMNPMVGINFPEGKSTWRDPTVDGNNASGNLTVSNELSGHHGFFFDNDFFPNQFLPH